MQNPKTILFIDDCADIRLSARFFLTNHGFNVVEADSPTTGLDMLNHQPVDLVLLDMNYSRDTTSGEEGLYCLRKIRALHSHLPVVAITAWAAVDLVVKALKSGARDFIEKPWDNQRLLQVIKQSLQLQQLEQHCCPPAREQTQAVKLVANSPAMQLLKSRLDEVAQKPVTLLLTGENGTGKSSLAHYIHQAYQQQHRGGALVSVNMGAIPENLFESEMFGHTKGAFTGADRARVGRFELAEHGTLFLDEVAEIPLPSQAKLLRVLESGQYERVGSSATQTASVRLISASNGNFKQLISEGRFRQDLYFRLNTIELHVPPLRERREDIPELAGQLLEQFCQRYKKPGISLLPCALALLMAYPFPGNLRELSHILERVVLLCEQTDISAALLAANGMASAIAAPVASAAGAELPLMTFEQAERELLDKALTQCKGQTQQAAELLGISKSAIYRRLEKYHIVAKDYL
ncbi:sigma-54-dependent transcriptional regulator [Bowmanella denitrificans]|uniref:sigma-54-dependent transcriptional regulator n=1 Tax=Bowmanella denitrificans TaxID=366582 RepID=UPI000C9B97D5|nr:sigma-54 dependent transcriptional regulator [Bowmanella denitrificans]